MMRDRLIKLLCGVECEGEETFGNCPQRRDGQCRTVQKLEMCQIGAIADHLIANGVIVPPCKVDDIVYMVTPGGKIHEKKVLGSASVVGLNLRDEIWMKHSFTCESALVFNEDDIGKTVFLTREEAEQTLKGEPR